MRLCSSSLFYFKLVQGIDLNISTLRLHSNQIWLLTEDAGPPIHLNEGSVFWLRQCRLQGVPKKEKNLAGCSQEVEMDSTFGKNKTHCYVALANHGSCRSDNQHEWKRMNLKSTTCLLLPVGRHDKSRHLIRGNSSTGMAWCSLQVGEKITLWICHYWRWQSGKIS